MEITLNYLKKHLTKEKSKNLIFTFLLALALVLNAYKIGLANVCLVLAVIYLFAFQKINFKLKLNLFIPILFYVLMILSLTWSLDFKVSLKALSKEVFFFIIPLLFIIKSDNTPFNKNVFYKIFTLLITILGVFYMTKGLCNFLIHKDINYLLYHDIYRDGVGLIPMKVNAIYISWYTLMAYFMLFSINFNKILKWSLGIILTLFLFLQSSKNLILVFIILNLIWIIYHYRFKFTLKRLVILIPVLLLSYFPLNNFIERYQHEFQNLFKSDFYYDNGVRHIGLQAVLDDNTTFSPNDYFSGTIFRLYQYISFKKIIIDNEKALGVGLNAVQPEIVEVMKRDNLNEGYYEMNFHNQYLQSAAELGLLGLIFTLWLLFEVFYVAIRDRDFLTLCFAISSSMLFFTESVFSVQRGIFFFVTLYCVFGYTHLNKNFLNKQN